MAGRLIWHFLRVRAITSRIPALYFEALERLLPEPLGQPCNAVPPHVQRLVFLIGQAHQHEGQADLDHLHRFDGKWHVGDSHRLDLPELDVLDAEEGYTLTHDVQQGHVIAGPDVLRCQRLTHGFFFAHVSIYFRAASTAQGQTGRLDIRTNHKKRVERERAIRRVANRNPPRAPTAALPEQ